MSVRSAEPRPCMRRLTLAALCCGLAALPAPSAHAQDTGEDAKDPSIVLMRKVQPRIAYRGIPLEDHPIASEATTFPGRVFRDAIEGVVETLVDDDMLDEHASAGRAVASVPSMLDRSLAPLGPTLAGQAVGSTPLGLSASSTGAIGGATGGLGSRIGNTLVPAVQGGGR